MELSSANGVMGQRSLFCVVAVTRMTARDQSIGQGFRGVAVRELNVGKEPVEHDTLRRFEVSARQRAESLKSTVGFV
ncbi:MAG TPA: hypothetical protein VG266_05305 [Candidatus Dormibacteraeota bacterium]|nr:hypothetical protein [Candidatus Dormibacteraeota bacterium]